MAGAEILSPHYDDAVYSCWNELGPSSRVTTIFGGYPADEQASDWDVSTGFDNARAAMIARQAENNEALSMTGARSLNLGFLDIMYPRTAALEPQTLHQALDEIIVTDTELVAPAGFTYGYVHLDHVMVREVAKLFMRQGRSLRFYADIPYSLKPGEFQEWPERLPKNEIERQLETSVDIVTVELTDAQAHAKELAVRTYRSQFDRNNTLTGNVFDDPLAYRWEAIILPR